MSSWWSWLPFLAVEIANLSKQTSSAWMQSQFKTQQTRGFYSCNLKTVYTLHDHLARVKCLVCATKTACQEQLQSSVSVTPDTLSHCTSVDSSQYTITVVMHWVLQKPKNMLQGPVTHIKCKRHELVCSSCRQMYWWTVVFLYDTGIQHSYVHVSCRMYNKKVAAKTGRDEQHNGPSSTCEKCSIILYYVPYFELTYTAGKVRQQLETTFQ